MFTHCCRCLVWATLAGCSCWFPVCAFADLINGGPREAQKPPKGNYAIVNTGEELSTALMATSPALKYVRVGAGVLVAQGDALKAAPFTTAYIDCDGMCQGITVLDAETVILLRAFSTDFHSR